MPEIIIIAIGSGIGGFIGSILGHALIWFITAWRQADEVISNIR